MKLAVIGATGMVGGYFIRILEERSFKADKVLFFASARSAGKIIHFMGKEHKIIALDDSIYGMGINIALLCAGGDISAQYAHGLAEAGTVVIDNSSHFRMQEGVPLIVPEVNSDAAAKHKGIIANPNCSTIQSVVALAPLHDAFGLKRVIYSTYQAVSGAGMEGWQDLENGLKGESPAVFSHAIANNLIPQIDLFKENAYTGEEMKMINETRKILSLPELAVTATCVRVPIFNVHSVSINVELEKEFDIKDVYAVLQAAKGITVVDEPAKNAYPMPITAEGKDDVFVGRIRRDESVQNGLNLWVVSDNLRKGAATNAIQIAEMFIL